MKTAMFERFEIELPPEAVADCSHAGPCDIDLDFWAPLTPRPAEVTPEKLAAELKSYGAWDQEELADDGQNWKRIVWLAAGNIKDEDREQNNP